MLCSLVQSLTSRRSRPLHVCSYFRRLRWFTSSVRVLRVSPHSRTRITFVERTRGINTFASPLVKHADRYRLNPRAAQLAVNHLYPPCAYTYLLRMKACCPKRASQILLAMSFRMTLRSNPDKFVNGKRKVAPHFYSRIQRTPLYCTRREFLWEILYKNIAIIAIQHSKMYFVDTFGDFSHCRVKFAQVRLANFPINIS